MKSARWRALGRKGGLHKWEIFTAGKWVDRSDDVEKKRAQTTPSPLWKDPVG